jgi:redox-sensitive bicupin YhaK (pirin superfamily)
MSQTTQGTQIIRSAERFHLDADWLSTYWHFSFDHYHDPANISFGPLRVFNDDVIRGGGGFPMHPHREMEIVTYVIEGELEHRDSMGNTGRIAPGEIQRMSAGTGLRHSEYNASEGTPVHLVQLWIIPDKTGLKPSWEQKKYSEEERSGRLLAIAVPEKTAGDEASGAVRIHQDATIYTSLLAPKQVVKHALAAGRRAYIFVVKGELNLQTRSGPSKETPIILAAGDQARIVDANSLELSGGVVSADFLLLDLP